MKRYPAILLIALLAGFGAVSSAGDEKKPDAKPAPKATEKTDKTVTKEGATAADAKAPARESIFAQAVRKKDPEVKVFTNEDLGEAPAGAPRPGQTPPASAGTTNTGAAADPLAIMKDQENRAAERAEMIKAAQQELAAAKARLASLEKELLATVNPFSARPALSEEEKEYRAQNKETASARHERIKESVELAKQSVADAEQRLARVKTQR